MADDLKDEELQWRPKLLTPEQIAEIERRWPRIEPYQIDRVADGASYDLRHSLPRAASRRRLRALHKKTGDLHRQLRGALIDPEITDALVGAAYFGSKPVGTIDALDTLRARLAALEDLQKLLASAEARLPKSSATKWPERHLVEAVAEIIEAAGYAADRSNGSPLIELVEMVLEAVASSRRGRAGSADSVVEHWLKEKSRSK